MAKSLPATVICSGVEKVELGRSTSNDDLSVLVENLLLLEMSTLDKERGLSTLSAMSRKLVSEIRAIASREMLAQGPSMTSEEPDKWIETSLFTP